MKDEGIKVLNFCLAGNILLLLLKGAVGLLVASQALKADAVNSAGDVMVSLAVLIGVRYALKPHDEGHHYGHGKMEALVSLMVGLLILAGTGFLLRDAYRSFTGNETAQPSVIALGVAVISIIAKVIMYARTKTVGRKLSSIALETNAKDQRNDILVSSCTAAAILLALLGQALGVHLLEHYSEPVLVALMSAFILRIAVEIMRESCGMLLDAAPKKEIVEGITSAASGADGVIKLNWLRCRKIGRGLLVDAAVEVHGSMSLAEAHEIGDAVKSAVMAAYPDVLDVLVHLNPGRV